MFSAVFKQLPESVADAITIGVRKEVHDIFQGPIKEHVTKFLKDDLQLSEGDFFLLLASIQPNYRELMTPPPAPPGPTEASEMGASGPTEASETGASETGASETGASEQLATSTSGASASATSEQLATSTSGASASATSEQLATSTSGASASESGASTPPDASTTSVFSFVSNFARGAANRLIEPSAERIKDSLADVPKQLKELFDKDAGRKLLREATIQGFRDLLTTLAQNEATKQAFLNAVAARIRAIVKGGALEDDKVFAAIVNGAKLDSTIDTYAQIAITLFESLIKRTNADVDAEPLQNQTARLVTEVVVQRQDAELQNLYEQLKSAHVRIGNFLAKYNVMDGPINPPGTAVDALKNTAVGESEPTETAETTETAKGGRRSRSVRRGAARGQPRRRRRSASSRRRA